MTADYSVPECLVLKLEEVDCDTGSRDTTIYVLYDQNEGNYVVRGHRQRTQKHNACVYSFVCEEAKDLANFLHYIICPHNSVSEVLYNYDNLPYDSTDITFEFLNEYDHQDYEISGYNNQKMNRKRLVRDLRMLKNVFNYY